MLMFLPYRTQRVCPDAMLSIGSYVKGTQYGNQRSLEKQARFTIDAYKRIAELEAKLA